MTCMFVACREASKLGADMGSLPDEVGKKRKLVVRGKSRVIRKADESVEEMDILGYVGVSLYVGG